MQEVFEKIIEKLEELKQKEKNRPDDCDENGIGDGEQIYEDGRSQGRYEQIVEIIKIVKQAAAEYNNGWIPCSERMPEKNGAVWVSFSNSVTDYARKAYWGYDIQEMKSVFKWENGMKMKIVPLAWKPYCSPEPYHPKGE